MLLESLKPQSRVSRPAIAMAGALCAVVGVAIISFAGASTILVGDVNKDNKVDVFDLSVLLSRWDTADSAADINASGKVDIFDLSLLLSHWGITGTTPTTATTSTPTSAPTPTRAPLKFPGVTHRAGAEHILTAAQVDTAISQGMTLSMNYGTAASQYLPKSEMAAKGMTYLDRTISDKIYKICPPNSGCTITPAQEDALIADVNAYLQTNKNDATIGGYYIIDDWNGNIPNTLKRVTAAVHAVTPDKPTVCAFAAILDYWPSSDHTKLPTIDHGAFNYAIANYTAEGCDIPDIYAYGAPYWPASDVDWTGQYFIPYMKSQLAARGWTPSMGFIITPQAFNEGANSYPIPTAQNIQTETASFCQAGAIATLAYIWGNFGDVEYLDHRPDWQAGYKAGNDQCKAIWNGAP